MHRLTFLLLNVRLNHLIGEVTRADCQVSSRPNMASPKQSPETGKFLQQNPRADSLQPLHNHAHVYVGTVRNQNVNVVAGYLPRQYRDFVLLCYLPNNVAHTNGDVSYQYLLTVFWYPYQMYLQVVLRVRAYLITFHATTLHNPKARLQGGGFPPSPMGTLKHARNSNETEAFLRDGQRILSAIPGVRDFQVLSQVSKKNNFDFGFSMKFSSAADYEKYSSHPGHAGFVEKRWKTEVSRFLEIDCEPFRLSPRS